MKETGVDGVMSSEAILENPGLYSGNTIEERYCGQTELARNYLELCERYGARYGLRLRVVWLEV